MYRCYLHHLLYGAEELRELRQKTTVHQWRQFLPCGCEFASLEKVESLKCADCGKTLTNLQVEVYEGAKGFCYDCCVKASY